MIPVTNSLFFKGFIENSPTVLVDIGTGYWMEKSHTEAIDYYKSKIEFISQQLMKINELLVEKTSNLNAISAYVQHIEESKSKK